MLNTLWMTSRWALLPTSISILLSLVLFPEFRHENALFHVFIESGGALIGFGLAYVTMAMIQKGHFASNYTWLIACFVFMGIMDLFHSLLAPGETFVWLHSLATFVGGFFALLIWLPAAKSARFFRTRYFYSVAFISISISLISINWPEFIPAMLDENRQFTWQAKLLNLGGGLAFMTTWLYFAREFYLDHHEKFYYFSNHFCLFAVAGFIFEFSVLWDGNWWFWHTMRVLAYLLLIYHFGKIYRSSLLYSLEISEKRLHAYIDSSPDWIWEVDANGVYTFASPKVYDLLGYYPEEIIGKTPFDLMPAEEAQRIGEIFGNIAASKQPFYNLENTNIHKNGRVVVLETSGVPILNLAGELTGYHGIDRDITLRKQNENELSLERDFTDTILDVAGNVIAVLDLDGRFVRFNKAAEKLTGYSSKEAIGKKAWELVIPATQVNGVRKTFENLKAGNVVISGEYENEWQTRAGQRRLLHWHNSVLRDSNGIISHIVTMGYDITEQRHSEKESLRLQNELQHALKMESLALLTGGIAHDFNNLLAIISGYTSLILDKYSNSDDEKLLDYMNHIRSATQRSTSLISQMLSFTRSTNLEKSPLQLAGVLQEDIQMLRATLPSSIEIQSHISDNLPDITISQAQFHQVIMNLSVNARDAMHGSGTLTIKLDMVKNLDTVSSVSHKPVKGDWVELSVTDTGSGINQNLLKKIFNPFFTTKEVGKGSGMGLSVIYRIVDDNHGHILVESEPGKGTTFRILFAPSSQTDHREAVAVEKNTTLLSAGDGSEILIVDDELVLARQLSEIVNHYGYTSYCLSNSTEALSVFSKDPQRFSLIITDQTMPGLSGTELIEKARELRPEIPAILCTGYSEQVDARIAEQRNIIYFDKPVELNELITKVNDLVLGSGAKNQ